MRMNTRQQDFDKLSNSLSDNLAIEQASLIQYDKAVEFDVLIVHERYRRKGVGSAALKDFCSFADKYRLVGLINPCDRYGTSEEELIAFYSRFGFVPNGNNEFPDHDGWTMVRPVQVEAACLD